MNRHNRKTGFTLIEIMIVVMIIGVLLAIAVPNFMRARATSRLKTILANLNQIDSAVQQWAIEQQKTPGGAVTQSNLDGSTGTAYISGSVPAWPSGPVTGTYAVSTVGAGATFDGGTGGSMDKLTWEATCGADPPSCGL
jgi:prepilin-type N-terminal cleavage/methylation domain-containing protein